MLCSEMDTLELNGATKSLKTIYRYKPHFFIAFSIYPNAIIVVLLAKMHIASYLLYILWNHNFEYRLASL